MGRRVLLGRCSRRRWVLIRFFMDMMSVGEEDPVLCLTDLTNRWMHDIDLTSTQVGNEELCHPRGTDVERLSVTTWNNSINP
mmetsp:Transcript_28334/g.53481  ORF Transcript_28334/g.53481 Transcript_28334/m.53481 type:complete len:82 (-) Transcript_28334:50-295(-)